MKIIGLTGGIGAGKTAVMQAFAGFGIPAVDTDQLAHQLSEPGSTVMASVFESFGAEALTETGALNRPWMRDKVFSDPEAKQRLEGIFHPAIHDAVMQQLDAYRQQTESPPYCLLVVPLLFETGTYLNLIDRALVIDCLEEEQVRRVMQRSQLSEASVRAIMQQQLPRLERLKRADDILDNSQSLADLSAKVNVLHQKYLQDGGITGKSHLR